MRYPVMYIDTRKIRENTCVISGMLRTDGMRLVGVAKGTMGHPAVVRAMVDGGAEAVGDARIENLRRLREQGFAGETVLLRAPSPSRVEEVVEVADVSLNSDIRTVSLLGEAARKIGKEHKVVLMVDLGDLREGVMVEDAVRTAGEMAKARGVEFTGIGTNLACHGGVIPTREKMEALLAVRHDIEEGLHMPVARVSGGNSANVAMVMRREMPWGINELRIGESILLGTEAIERRPVPGCHRDAFRIAAEIIEISTKPSKPFGRIGQDAFGAMPVFGDRGNRRRAILALGRQDVDPGSLTPEDDGVEVIGASSDHLLCDVENADPSLASGSVLTFIPGYSALLRASTSPFVEKVVQ